MDAVLFTPKPKLRVLLIGPFDCGVRSPTIRVWPLAIGRFHYLPSVVYIINCVSFAHFAQERKALARHVDP